MLKCRIPKRVPIKNNFKQMSQSAKEGMARPKEHQQQMGGLSKQPQHAPLRRVMRGAGMTQKSTVIVIGWTRKWALKFGNTNSKRYLSLQALANIPLI